MLCNEMDYAVMVIENENVVLNDFLLGPFLGAYLVLFRKVCFHAGLNRIFDARAM